MCGIFCLITRDCGKSLYLVSKLLLDIYFYLVCTINIFLSKVDLLRDQIGRRGPDYHDIKKWSTRNDIHLYFLSSILWMRGEKLMPQPTEDSESIFLYNGNIYGEVFKENNKLSDTFIMLKILEQAVVMSEILLNVEGPYSLIYLDKTKSKLYFARDHFGRISLLIGKNNDAVVLCSVAKKALNLNFIELPSIGIFCWDLELNKLILFSYPHRNSNFMEKVTELEQFLENTIEVKQMIENKLSIDYITPPSYHLNLMSNITKLNTGEAFQILLNNENWMSNVLTLENLLETSLKKRINMQPKHCRSCIKDMVICNHSLLGILFSGGVDCAILAVLSDKVIDKKYPIDLMNVSFDEENNYNSPDRQTGLETLNELRKICPDREWRFLEINISKKELNEKRKDHISHLIYPLQTILDDSLGCALWLDRKSVV